MIPGAIQLLALLVLAPPLWAAETVGGQTLPGGTRPDSGGAALAASPWRLILACLVAAALLYLGSRILRRLPLARFLPTGDGLIRIESRAFLGAKASLCLVRVGTQAILVGVSAGRMVPLHAWHEADAPGARQSSHRPLASSAPAPEARGAWGSESSAELPAQLRSLGARLGGRPR
jgi:flagellar protein FliO/FliZ